MNTTWEDTDWQYRYAIYTDAGYFGAVTNWQAEEPQNWSSANVTVYERGKDEPVFVKGKQLSRLPNDKVEICDRCEDVVNVIYPVHVWNGTKTGNLQYCDNCRRVAIARKWANDR